MNSKTDVDKRARLTQAIRSHYVPQTWENTCMQIKEVVNSLLPLEECSG